MSPNWLNTTFCKDCSQQFDAKSVFDIHLSIVHKQNLVVVKEEPPSLCGNGVKTEEEEENKPNLVIVKEESSFLSNELKEKESDPLLLDDNATITPIHHNQGIPSVYDDKETFECSVCNYKCSQKGQLNQHIASVHEGKKPEKLFKCSNCDYRGRTKWDIQRHSARIHQRKKPHECSICDYKCSEKGSLKKHTTSVHEGKKPFKCFICDYRFSESIT